MKTMTVNAIPVRRRRLALGAVLILQAAFFSLFLKRPLRIEADNARYEVAAYNLAMGRGLSLPLSMTNDRYIFGLVCDRHPSACEQDTTHPVAIYPPGYSFFVAGVYTLFGRSLPAVAICHLLLLLALFATFEGVAARFLDRTGYLFAMGVCCVYPFLARQAAFFMSDHLHIVTFVIAIASLILLKPGVYRGLLFGGLMVVATLVRPYCLLVFPLLCFWPSVWRSVRGRATERIVAVVVFLVPMLLWTGRNAYWFGKFVPLTTSGPGVLLMHTTLEWEPISRYAPQDRREFYEGLEERIGGRDPLSYEGDRAARALARDRITAHPVKFALVILGHIPKLWISFGTQQGASRAWPLLMAFLGGLLVLGLYGMWLKRKDERYHAMMLAILSYWLFLLYSPGEARRTLPLRLFMLVFGGIAVSALNERWRARSRVGIAEEYRGG